MSSSLFARSLAHLRLLASETYFVQTPIVTPANPLALLNDSVLKVRSWGLAGPFARRGAVGACEQARQVCRHVDIAAQRNPAAWKGPIIQRPQENEELLRLALKLASQNAQEQSYLR